MAGIRGPGSPVTYDSSSSGSAGGISVVVGSVLVAGSVIVGFLADDVVVAIEMHLDLGAVVTLDLDLVDAAGAIPFVSIVSLYLGEGSAAHRSDRGALRLLGLRAGEPLLGVSAVIVRSEIVPTWVIVEASGANAIVGSKVIGARVVVLGERRRREDQRAEDYHQHYH